MHFNVLFRGQIMYGFVVLFLFQCVSEEFWDFVNEIGPRRCDLESEFSKHMCGLSDDMADPREGLQVMVDGGGGVLSCISKNRISRFFPPFGYLTI